MGAPATADPRPPPPRPSGRGGLRSAELADAAVLAGVSLVLILVGYFFPHASIATVLAAVPMAVLAHRHRQRTVVAATVAGSSVAFLIAGTGPVVTVIGCGFIGGLAGCARRCHWGWPRTLLTAAVLGPPLGGLADAFLAVFAQTRRLSLAQVVNTWKGAASLLRHLPAISPLLDFVTRVVHLAVHWWWLTVPLGVTASVVSAVAVAWVVTGPVVERLEWVPRGDLLETGDDGAPGPVPVELSGVSYSYPGAPAPALSGVDLVVAPATLTVVVGPNGSGKSTLGRILLGADPSGGTVRRPGAAGLGHPGGAAVVLQRPETQILGVRVIDDLRWGLPADEHVDVPGLLATVGLAGMEQRDTSTLSGGELQRLAVAGALARRPRLLVSDESTAMVDAAGRVALMDLLRRLPSEKGTAVVHITHRLEEAEGADQVVGLSGGRRVPAAILAGASRQAPEEAAASPLPAGAPRFPAGSVTAPRAGAAGRRQPPAGPMPPGGRLPPAAAAAGNGGAAGSGGADLVVSGVSHVWADGTPWRQPALAGVDLRIGAGEGVLVLGGNGSGKSTLAWVMAGLLAPSDGECLLGGVPVTNQVGQVGLAFQHARLQLLRPTVASDVRHAGGVNGQAAEDALRAVGLDPAVFSGRHVDQLSGGQMRRVALAGLLARRTRVLVLDEPLAGLDHDAQQGLIAALTRLRHAGVTVVMVSHDLTGTERCCERVVRLDKGRVVEDRPSEVAAWP